MARNHDDWAKKRDEAEATFRDLSKPIQEAVLTQANEIARIRDDARSLGHAINRVLAGATGADHAGDAEAVVLLVRLRNEHNIKAIEAGKELVRAYPFAEFYPGIPY